MHIDYVLSDINKTVSDIIAGKTEYTIEIDESMESMGRFYRKDKRIVLKASTPWILYHECFHAYVNINNGLDETLRNNGKKYHRAVVAYHAANRDFSKMDNISKANFLAYYFLAREETCANMYAYYQTKDIGTYYDTYEQAFEWISNNKEYIYENYGKDIESNLVHNITVIHSFLMGKVDIKYVLRNIW